MKSLLKFFLIFSIVFLAAACKKTQTQEKTTTQTPAVVEIAPVVTPTKAPLVKTYQTASGKKPQFVVMAFDGSRSLEMWQKTLDFAKEQQNIHFTYFLSGVYFLNYRKADRYLPPDGQPGHSLIGFADSNTDIEKRVAFVNRALAEGHEIGSHLNGHFNGAKWTKKDWEQEFSEFRKLIFSIDKDNDVSAIDAPRYKLNLDQKDLVGFRAPDLGRNSSMDEVLKQNGFLYDTSSVGKEDEWPKKLQNGLWEFPLVSIQYANTKSKILSMDYNFYFKQSKAKDTAKKASEEWQKFYSTTYTSYLNYFNNNYNTTRAPVFIGSHFSEWNDGAYWEAMRDFGKEVCGKPEVYCVSFKELMGYLDSQN